MNIGALSVSLAHSAVASRELRQMPAQKTMRLIPDTYERHAHAATDPRFGSMYRFDVAILSSDRERSSPDLLSGCSTQWKDRKLTRGKCRCCDHCLPISIWIRMKCEHDHWQVEEPRFRSSPSHGLAGVICEFGRCSPLACCGAVSHFVRVWRFGSMLQDCNFHQPDENHYYRQQGLVISIQIELASN